MNELILRLVIFIAIWLFALIFLRRLIGLLILKLCGLLVGMVLKVPVLRKRLLYGRTSLQVEVKSVSQNFEYSSNSSASKDTPPLNVCYQSNHILPFLPNFIIFKKWHEKRILANLKNKRGDKYTKHPRPEVVNTPVDKGFHHTNSSTGEKDESTICKQNHKQAPSTKQKSNTSNKSRIKNQRSKTQI